MRYLAKSAAVLNEADRFEGILNWTLFTAEQDHRLWGYNPEVKWVPGQPIYQHPHFLPLFMSDLDDDMNFGDGRWGNHVRPMIEEMPDGDPRWTMRCRKCEVSWRDSMECWMCGESCPWPMASVFTVYDEMRIDNGDLAREFSDHNRRRRAQLQIDLSPQDFSESIRVMREVWAHLTPEMGNAFDRFRRATVTGRRAATRLYTFLEELREFRPEPVIIHGVEIPANWAELKPDIPLPALPELPDYSTWEFTNNGPSNATRRHLNTWVR